MMVKIDEIIEALSIVYELRTGLNNEQRRLVARIKEEGIAPPDGYVLVPIVPTDYMIYAGGHVNSEWLNDNAPLGESRYQLPIVGIYKSMLASAQKDKP